MNLGPLRVGWIRVERSDERSVYRVVGTAHRRPVTRRVPAAVASRLIAQGVPVVVARRPPASGRPGRTRAA